MMRALAILVLLSIGCGGSHSPPDCKPMPCASPCGAVGYKTDPATGCRLSCECNGPAQSCPVLMCTSTCGLGKAQDATTGCPTCGCCNPADCEPGGCNSTGNDGCPTCVPC